MVAWWFSSTTSNLNIGWRLRTSLPTPAIRPSWSGKAIPGPRAAGSTVSSWSRRRWTFGAWIYEQQAFAYTEVASAIGASGVESSANGGRASPRGACAVKDRGQDSRQRQNYRCVYAYGQRQRRVDPDARTAARGHEVHHRERENAGEGGGAGGAPGAAQQRGLAGADSVCHSIARLL